MGNFWDFSSWGFFNLVAVLMVSLLAANMLKRLIPVLQASLIPTSVLGGGILLAVSVITRASPARRCLIPPSSAATVRRDWNF